MLALTARVDEDSMSSTTIIDAKPEPEQRPQAPVTEQPDPLSPEVDIRDLVQGWDSAWNGSPCNVYLVHPDLSNGQGHATRLERIPTGKISWEAIQRKYGGGLYEIIWYLPKRQRFVHREHLPGPNLVAAKMGIDQSPEGDIDRAIVRVAEIQERMQIARSPASSSTDPTLVKLLEKLADRMDRMEHDKAQAPLMQLLVAQTQASSAQQTALMGLFMEMAKRGSAPAGNLVENVSDVLELTERLQSLSGRSEEPWIEIVKALAPQLGPIAAAVMARKAGAAAAQAASNAAPTVTVQGVAVDEAAKPQAAPVANPPAEGQAPTPAGEERTRDQAREQLRKFLVLDRLEEAVTTRDMTPEEFAEWAIDALPVAVLEEYASAEDVVKLMVEEIRPHDLEGKFVPMLEGPGAVYLRELVAVWRGERDGETPN